jgi:hypothetical protein
MRVRAQLPASIADLVPVPTMAPPLPVRPTISKNYTLLAPATTSSAGLGNPLIIAIGAFTMTIPLWAVVILAIAAVAVIAYGIYMAVEAVLSLNQIDANTLAVDTYYRATQTAMNSCLAQGRSAVECRAVVDGIQTPHDVMPTPPTGTEGPTPIDWNTIAKYAAFSVGGVALISLSLAFLKYRHEN